MGFMYCDIIFFFIRHNCRAVAPICPDKVFNFIDNKPNYELYVY